MKHKRRRKQHWVGEDLDPETELANSWAAQWNLWSKDCSLETERSDPSTTIHHTRSFAGAPWEELIWAPNWLLFGYLVSLLIHNKIFEDLNSPYSITDRV